MNDLERDLREMFRRREADLPPAAKPPPRIARRVRRRLVGTGLIAGAIAIALIAVGILGYGALTDERRRQVPAEDSAGTMTAHAGGVAITYPTAWHLAAFGEGSDEKIVLTNFEMPPAYDDPCATMPADGVALLVMSDEVIPGDGEPVPWPVELQPVAAPAHCTGDGGGSAWSTPVGRTFGAQGFLGPNASEEDRSRMVEAFDSMRFFSHQDGVSGSGTVLASGVIDGRPWTLFFGPGGVQGFLSFGQGVSIETARSGSGLSNSGLGAVEVDRGAGIAYSAPVMHGNTFLFGGASAEVTRLRVSLEGADTFDVPLLDLPTSADTSIRAFVAPLQGAPRGTVTTYDASGSVLSALLFSPGSSCSARQPCDGAAGEPLAEGQVGDTRWELIERDGGVQLVDGEGTLLGSVDGIPDPLLVSAVTIGSGDDAVQIPFGLASPETTSVVLFSSGLPGPATTALLQDGTVAFWAPVTPPPRDGQILAFDADCRLLEALLIDTGEPPPVPATTDCVT